MTNPVILTTKSAARRLRGQYVLDSVAKMALENTTDKTCLFLADVQLDHTGYVYALEVFTCVLNSVLPLVAVTGNLLVIFVIFNTPTLHSPPNVFLSCLAASNFVLAAMAQPSYVVYKVSEITGNRAVWCHGRIVHWFVGFLCAGVSVLTITAIAVERYLALYLHLKYVTSVTVKRCLIAAISFWIFCFLVMLSLFFMNSDRYWTVVPIPVMCFSIVLTTAAYTKIFRILRWHQNKILSQTQHAWQTSANTGVNLKSYKRTALTMLYILVLFCVCHLPVLLAMIVRVVIGYTRPVKLAYELAATGFYLSSSINPVFYCWRMKDVREAVLNTLKKLQNLSCAENYV